MVLVLGTQAVRPVTVESREVSAGEEGDDDSVDPLQLVEVCVLVVKEGVEHVGSVARRRGVVLTDHEGLYTGVPGRPRLGHSHQREEDPELAVEEAHVFPSENIKLFQLWFDL